MTLLTLPIEYLLELRVTDSAALTFAILLLLYNMGPGESCPR